MATPKKRPVRSKAKPETVRERAAKQSARTPRKRKTTNDKNEQAKGKVSSFLAQSVKTHEHKENSRWSFLTKPRSFVPGYLRNSFTELKNVTWPRLPEALRLTFAVILFAAIFTVLVTALDWVLERVFEELILNKSENIINFIKDIF